MARPQRCRVVCSEPEYVSFEPNGVINPENVILSIDEYEVIRLVGFEKQSHEQCASIMGISRTTVTEIYERARFKISDCIVNGKNKSCCKKICYKNINNKMKEEGEKNMKIAVTYENGEIFQHFGHTENFKMYVIEEGKIVKSEVINSNGAGHGALAVLLKRHDVNALICGGIGGGAQRALADVGIEVYGGVSGNAEQAVLAFINGNLEYNSNVECNHHSHSGNHSCGSNGCH